MPRTIDAPVPAAAAGDPASPTAAPATGSSTTVVAPPVPAQASAPVFDAAYLENPAPPYPRAARRGGLEGRVVLRVHVNPDGTADEVLVRTSSGHDSLDEAARATVARWRFAPARRGDIPVAAWVLVPVSFRLDT